MSQDLIPAKTLTEATESSQKEAKFWLDQLRQAGRVEEKWRRKADDLVERYRDEERESGTRLNLFWANTQLLKPRVYSQSPAPDVRRRNISEDPMMRQVGREVATLLERCLSYSIDAWDFDAPIAACRDDMLITGRGVTREVYDAEIVTIPDPLTGQPVEIKASERVDTRFVYWADFRLSPCRTWEDCWWIAFRHPMDREQLEAEFGKEETKGVPLVITPGRDNDHDEDTRQPADPEHAFGRAEVWEIWSKRQRTRVWVATGHDKVIRKDGDPLGLADFFPMPCPLYAVSCNDSMVPLPEFELYRDQANELDELQDRIRQLTKVLKAVAVIDGDAVEVLSIRDAKDGTAVPVGSPGRTAEDLDKSIWWWRITEISQVIAGLSLRAEQVKQQIFEVTGLSDLSRGATKERETAAAQKLKAGFGDVRMSPRSQPMAEYIRDSLRIKAEIMAEHFEPETLQMIGGVQVLPEMVHLLKDEKLRNTQIEIATDSTVRPDKLQEKQEALDFLTSVAQYLGAVAPIAAQAPQMTPLLLEMLKQAASTFKFGKNFEEMIGSLADMAQEPMMPPAQNIVPNGVPV